MLSIFGNAKPRSSRNFKRCLWTSAPDTGALAQLPSALRRCSEKESQGCARLLVLRRRRRKGYAERMPRQRYACVFSMACAPCRSDSCGVREFPTQRSDVTMSIFFSLQKWLRLWAGLAPRRCCRLLYGLARALATT
jgi:hypothetical protein